MSAILRKSISSVSQTRTGQALNDTANFAGSTSSHISTLTTTTTITGTTAG